MRRLTEIFRGNFGRHLRVHSSAALVSQILMIAIAPVLVRLYSPEQLGLYSLIVGGSTLAAIVFSLRLEQEIMLARDEDEASRIATTVGLLAVAAGLLSVGVFNVITWPLGLAGLTKWGTIALALGISTAILRLMTLLNFRMKQFSTVSLSRISQAATSCAVWSACGWFGFADIGLATGLATGQVAAAAFLVPAHARTQHPSYAPVRTVFRRGWRSITFAVPSELAKVLSVQLPLVVFSADFGLAAAGHLSLALRVVATPARFIGNAVGDVFFAHASRHPENTRPLLMQTLGGLALLGIIGFGILFFSAQPVFEFIFGAAWRDAAQYTRILTPYLLASFVITPAASVLIIARKQKFELAWQIFILAVAAAALYGAVASQLSAYEVLIVYSISCTISYFYYFYIIFVSST